MNTGLIRLALLSLGVFIACQQNKTQETQPPAFVKITSPANGTTVPPTFKVTMLAQGLTIAPAGVVAPNQGHFHLLINTDFIAAGQIIPKTEQHLHYGKGELEAELTLTPGQHTIGLQFADGAHIALEGSQYRDTITVNVVAP